MKKASVIIPLYNSRDFIPKVLQFLTQHHDKYETEIIVVNDGSTDGSCEKIVPYMNFIKFVDLGRNFGRSAARNKGIEVSDGEVLIFLDADCLPKDEDFFRLHLNFHDSCQGCLNGQVVLPLDLMCNNYIRFRHPCPTTNGIKEVSAASLATGNVSIRKTDMLAVGGFDESLDLMEDGDLGIRLAKHGLTIYQDDRVTVFHIDGCISLINDMCRNYRAYGECVKKILAKDTVNIEYLPLVKMFEYNTSRFFHFKHKFMIAHLLKLQRYGDGFLPRRLLNCVYGNLIVGAAYNGYYGYNVNFFNTICKCHN